MGKLLLCPFCGQKAEAFVYGATGQWIVKCPCGVEMNRLIYDEEEAIEAWNTRYMTAEVLQHFDDTNNLEDRSSN